MTIVNHTPSNSRSSANNSNTAEPAASKPLERLSCSRRIQTVAANATAAAMPNAAQMLSDNNPSTLAHAPKMKSAEAPDASAAQLNDGTFRTTPAMPSAVNAVPANSIQFRNCGASPPSKLVHTPRSSIAHSMKAAFCHAIKTTNASRPAAGAAAVSPCLNHDSADTAAKPEKNRMSAGKPCPL